MTTITRVGSQIILFLDLLFTFALAPFRALWDGRRELEHWRPGQWLAGFVLVLFALTLLCVRAAMDGDPGWLILLVSGYFGACALCALVGMAFGYAMSQYD